MTTAFLGALGKTSLCDTRMLEGVQSGPWEKKSWCWPYLHNWHHVVSHLGLDPAAPSKSSDSSSLAVISIALLFKPPAQNLPVKHLLDSWLTDWEIIYFLSYPVCGVGTWLITNKKQILGCTRHTTSLPPLCRGHSLVWWKTDGRIYRIIKQVEQVSTNWGTWCKRSKQDTGMRLYDGWLLPQGGQGRTPRSWCLKPILKGEDWRKCSWCLVPLHPL